MEADFAVTAKDDGIPTIDLEDRRAGSLVTLAPGRGGMATRMRAGGREVFYLDRATLLDPSANVRGGNPVLFPSPGKLTGDTWRREGRSGSMKQHGFARTLPWRVVATGTDGAARATLRLEPSDVTRGQFPWDTSIELGYGLVGATLRIDIRVENLDSSPMPFGVGFHPYFLVAQGDKARAHIPTAATRAFDNTTKREVPFEGFDLTRPEVDLHLVDHGGPAASLERGDGTSVVLTGSPELRRWVIWTVAGKDFVCVEPWTCPGDALNTGAELLELAPGATRSLWLEIAVAQPAGVAP